MEPKIEAKCSRAGCANAAEKIIEWRNPKIHGSDRTKQWGSCLEHLEFLIDYLQARGFYLGHKEIR